MTDQGRQPPPTASFEQPVERFATEPGEARERGGRRTEPAGKRWAADPAIVQTADTAARIWGLLLILGLIVIGLAVILRGVRRRSA